MLNHWPTPAGLNLDYKLKYRFRLSHWQVDPPLLQNPASPFLRWLKEAAARVCALEAGRAFLPSIPCCVYWQAHPLRPCSLWKYIPTVSGQLRRLWTSEPSSRHWFSVAHSFIPWTLLGHVCQGHTWCQGIRGKADVFFYVGRGRGWQEMSTSLHPCGPCDEKNKMGPWAKAENASLKCNGCEGRQWVVLSVIWFLAECLVPDRHSRGHKEGQSRKVYGEMHLVRDLLWYFRDVSDSSGNSWLRDSSWFLSYVRIISLS